jgi:6,7-dimethyl-8-ribityllumazine synthase
VSSARYAIVISRYYAELAERLEAGARAAFADAGIDEVEVHEVAGAFELPLGAKYAAESGQFEGVVCLGVVIRGETTHYDHVCEETARGIMDVQLRTGVPVGFGVVTVENAEQALARTGGGKRDEGRHAAEAALRMAALRRELSGTRIP